MRTNAKPRVVGRNRKGTWKWIVYTSDRSYEFTLWMMAIGHANNIARQTHKPMPPGN